MTAAGKREPSAKDIARLGQQKRDRGEGGLSWSVYDQKWIGSVELPPDPRTGKRRRQRVKHADKITALAMLQELRNKVARGDIAPVRQKGMNSVADWLTYWVENISKPDIKPKTLESYRNAIHSHLIPAIGSVRIGKLAPHHIREMHEEVIRKANVRADGTRSTRTAILCHTVLNMAMKAAWREGYVTENVVAKVVKPKPNPESRGWLTKDQSLQLLRSCLEHEDRMTTRIAAALMTGARQGELIGLQWDRVNFAEGTVDLAWQLQELRQRHGCGEPDEHDNYPCGKLRAGYCPDRWLEVPRNFAYKHLCGALYLTRPKTDSSVRIVPIPEELRQTLATHYSMTRHEPNPYDLVWHQPNGKPIAPTRDAKAWKGALKRAGLGHVPLHAARHTTASLLLEAKVDPKIIQQILGHSEILTTRGYQHVPMELAQQSVAPLGGLLSLGSKS